MTSANSFLTSLWSQSIIQVFHNVAWFCSNILWIIIRFKVKRMIKEGALVPFCHCTILCSRFAVIYDATYPHNQSSWIILQQINVLKNNYVRVNRNTKLVRIPSTAPSSHPNMVTSGSKENKISQWPCRQSWGLKTAVHKLTSNVWFCLRHVQWMFSFRWKETESICVFSENIIQLPIQNKNYFALIRHKTSLDLPRYELTLDCLLTSNILPLIEDER